MQTGQVSANKEQAMESEGDVVRELRAASGGEPVHGVTYDGRLLWAAIGPRLVALDPQTGEVKRTLETPADAGTAFDGKYLYQLADTRIDKIDPASGEVISSIPAPGGGNSGMAWAEGSLWVGQFQTRKIHQVDPDSGKILRTLESNRFVTGVTWVEGELWHATWEDEHSELRRVDSTTGQVQESISMPAGYMVSGLDADDDVFYCGGGGSGKVRAVKRRKGGTR